MKRYAKLILSLLMSVILLGSMILPSLAASYQNGDTTKVTVSGVWAFHGGRQPGKPVPPATAVIAEITITTGYTGMRATVSTSCKWTGASIPRNTAAKPTFTAYTNGSIMARLSGQFFLDPSGKGDLTRSLYWQSLSLEKRKLLMLVSIYGFPSRTPQQLGVSTVDDAYAATQAIIWEIVTGRRNATGLVSNYKSAGNEDTPKTAAAKDNARYFYEKYMLYPYTATATRRERPPRP